MSEGQQQSGVVVTLSQMYSEMQAMHGEVREMRAELQGSLKQVDDHETRIRALERKLWIATGSAVVLSSTLGAVISSLLHLGA